MNTLVLAILLAMAPADSSPQMQEAAALYTEGTDLYESADYNGAIQKFTKALGIVRSVDGDDHTRLTLLWNIGSAHEKAFTIDQDVAHLRQALALYKRYREFAQNTGNIGEELDVEARIIRLERKIRTHDQIEENRTKAKTQPVPAPPPVEADVEWKKPRNTGIGLMAGGAALTIGGTVLAIVGSRMEPNAQAEVDKLNGMGLPPDHPAFAEGESFVEAEKRKGNALMGTGITVAVIGAAGIGTGAYYLVKSKKMRDKNVSVVPALSPGFAGIQISGRF